jgi:hypothetical protein
MPLNLSDDEKALVELVAGKQKLADEGAHKTFRKHSEEFYSLYRGLKDFQDRHAGTDRRDRDRAVREAQGIWGEDLHIPYAFRTVETVIPRMLAHRPRILYLPWDESALGNTDNMQMLVDRQQQRFKYELLLQDIAKDALIYGLGVQKTGWKKEYRKITRATPATVPTAEMQFQEVTEKVCTVDDAWVWYVDPFDFFWDPYAAEIADCSFVIHRTWRDTSYLERMFKEKHWTLPTDVTLEDVRGMGPNTRRDDVWQGRRDAEGYGDSKPQGEHLHEVWEYHDRDRVITVLDATLPVQVADNPTASGELPFQVYRPTKKGGVMVGMGEIEPIRDLQYEINTLRSQRRDAVAFSLIQAYAFDDSVIDADDLKGGVFPGAAIPVNGQPRDFLFPLPFKEPSGNSFQEEAAIRSDLDTTSGISDTVTGGEGTGGAANTATGVQLVQAAAGERIKNKGRRCELELAAAAGDELRAENQRRIVTARLMPVPDPDAGPDRPAWKHVTLTPNDLAGRMSAQVEGGSMAAENTPQKRQDVQMWMQLQQSGMFRPEFIARQVAEGMGIKHLEGALMPPGPVIEPEALAAFVEQSGIDPNAFMPAFMQFLEAGPDGQQQGPPQGEKPPAQQAA